MRIPWSGRESSTRSGRGSPPASIRRWRLLLVPAVCTGMVIAFGPTPGASAAPKPFGGNDHPTQVTGTAVRYGVSAPLPRTAATAPAHAAAAKDSGVAHQFSRDPRPELVGDLRDDQDLRMG